jgi:hypothetical protein
MLASLATKEAMNAHYVRETIIFAPRRISFLASLAKKGQSVLRFARITHLTLITSSQGLENPTVNVVPFKQSPLLFIGFVDTTTSSALPSLDGVASTTSVPP